MKIRLPIATAVLALASLSIAVAQAPPSAPRNLRIVGSGGGGGNPDPGPAIPCDTIPARAGGAHAYFDAMVALPQHKCNWSLRDQAQLNGLVGVSPSRYFTYNPSGDTNTQKQDAAKYFKPADDQIGGGSDSIPGNQQLAMPLGILQSSGDTVLVAWDFFYGTEFKTNIGNIANYKIFQLRSGNINSGGIYIGPKVHFNQAVGAQSIGTHGQSLVPTQGVALPPGMTRADGLSPTGVGAKITGVLDPTSDRYHLYHSTWTRYWLEVRTNVSGSAFTEWANAYNGGTPLTGNWVMVSMWAADEGRNPTRLMYKVPWKIEGTHLTSFDFEFNTSSPPPAQTGPLVGYARNVIALKNYALPQVPETDSRIFVRPVR